MPSNHLILCHPLLLPPSIFPSIRVFSNESVLRIRWPKYWSFSFNISPSIECSGLISFRMDWLDLLAVQGTLKSLLQHYSSKASILWRSSFFIVQLSHPYTTTGKTIALTRWTFVGKIMSLLIKKDPIGGRNKFKKKKKTSWKCWYPFSSVQSLSHVWLFVTPWTAATRLPCPSPIPRVYPNSCPLGRWSHPTISSSVIPFSSHLQSFPALGFFQMSQFFESDGQSIRVSASASVLPMNIQDWLPLGWTGLISLQPKGLSRVFSNTTVQKHQFFGAQLSL